MINKTTTNIQTPAFKANPTNIYKAIKNGAKTCPHAQQCTEQLVDAVAQLGKNHHLKIDIPLRGSAIQEKTLAQLPQGVSDITKKAVDEVIEMINRPFGFCKDGCNKQGLTNGEVASNVFVNWGSHKSHDIGNPFTLSTKSASNPITSIKNMVKGIFSKSERTANRREALGFTRNPFTSTQQRADFYADSLKQANIPPQEVNYPPVRKALATLGIS